MTVRILKLAATVLLLFWYRDSHLTCTVVAVVTAIQTKIVLLVHLHGTNIMYEVYKIFRSLPSLINSTVYLSKLTLLEISNNLRSKQVEQGGI